jgi:site-specific recombinase XerD
MKRTEVLESSSRDTQSSQSQSLWQGLLDGFERRLSINKRPRTVAEYRRLLGEFRAFLSGELGLSVDPTGYSGEHVEEWLVRLAKAGKSNNTRRNHLTALRTFEKFLLDRSEIPRERLARIPWPQLERKPIPRALTEDLGRMLRTTKGRTLEDRRDYALLLLLMHLGPRTSEVAGMDRSDIDLKRGVATFHGKGGRDYAAALHPKVIDALDAYLWQRRNDRDPALWVAVRGRSRERLTSAGVYQIVRRRARHAGVEGMTVHLIRHTVAMEHKRSGLRDDAMRRVMGWSRDSRMPDYYTEAEADERARTAQREHSLLDRL